MRFLTYTKLMLWCSMSHFATKRLDSVVLCFSPPIAHQTLAFGDEACSQNERTHREILTMRGNHLLGHGADARKKHIFGAIFRRYRLAAALCHGISTARPLILLLCKSCSA